MASTPYPSHLNAACSPQLREEVAFFQQWGYLVVDDALTSEQVDALRTALDATFAQSDEQFIHQLLECDEAFAFLLDNSPVFSRMKAILGECVQLHYAGTRHAGRKDQTAPRCALARRA